MVIDSRISYKRSIWALVINSKPVLVVEELLHWIVFPLLIETLKPICVELVTSDELPYTHHYMKCHFHLPTITQFQIDFLYRHKEKIKL